MSLGARIMELRKAKGLSQAQLAKQVGISQPALANYERDGRDPPSSFLSALCEQFGADPAWLLIGAGNIFRQDMDAHYTQSIRVAWTYLSANSHVVDRDKLLTLGSALFHYLMEHGEMSEPMKDKIARVAA